MATVVKAKSLPLGTQTQTAGTVITDIFPGIRGLVARCTSLRYLTQGTAHAVHVMKPLSQGTTLAAAVAAAGTAISYTAEPGPSGNALSNNDWVGIELDNGNWHLSLATSHNGTSKTFTASALPSAANAGNKLVFFGLPADTGHFRQTTTVNSVENLLNVEEFVTADNANDPLMVHSANGAAAGTLLLGLCEYVRA